MRPINFTVTFYQIERQRRGDPSTQWYRAEGIDAPGMPRAKFANLQPDPRFSACGDCWQQSGFFGTFDYEYAKRCFDLAQDNHEYNWRIVKRTVSNDTTVVLSLILEDHT